MVYNKLSITPLSSAHDARFSSETWHSISSEKPVKKTDRASSKPQMLRSNDVI